MKTDAKPAGYLTRQPMVGLGLLVAISFAIIGIGNVTGLGRLEVPVAPGPAQAARDLLFFDRDDGGIDIVDAANAGVVARLEPATNGFLRSTVRGLVRERKRRDIGPEAPFHLALGPDGRLILGDPATGRTIDLRAFGPTNLDVFARLLPPAARESSLVTSAVR